jgi:hypothetical protein
MTWYLKVKNSDGTVHAILKDDWKDLVRDLADFRHAQREAWIEDVNGRVLDQSTGQPKQ